MRRPPPGGRAGVAVRPRIPEPSPRKAYRHTQSYQPVRLPEKLSLYQVTNQLRSDAIDCTCWVKCSRIGGSPVERSLHQSAAFFHVGPCSPSARPDRFRPGPVRRRHVNRAINRDHQLVTLGPMHPGRSVVQRCHGLMRPGMATGHPRATSRGRRAEARTARRASTRSGPPPGGLPGMCRCTLGNPD